MEGETIIPNTNRSFKHPGTLLDLDEGKKYKLKVGEQTVGRKDDDEDGHDKPDVAIETKDQYMSRIHLHVSVIKKGEDKYYHSFRVDSNTKNATYLNGVEVDRKELFLEELFLEENQVISMPLAKIQIIDED